MHCVSAAARKRRASWAERFPGTDGSRHASRGRNSLVSITDRLSEMHGELRATLAERGGKKKLAWNMATCSQVRIYYSLRYLRVLDYAMRWLFPLMYAIYLVIMFGTIGSTVDGSSGRPVARTC